MRRAVIDILDVVGQTMEETATKVGDETTIKVLERVWKWVKPPSYPPEQTLLEQCQEALEHCENQPVAASIKSPPDFILNSGSFKTSAVGPSVQIFNVSNNVACMQRKYFNSTASLP